MVKKVHLQAYLTSSELKTRYLGASSSGVTTLASTVVSVSTFYIQKLGKPSGTFSPESTSIGST
jgi:hypothetical protein